MSYYVVIKPNAPYPIGRYFVGTPDGGLKQAEWRHEEGEEHLPQRLLPKFGQIIIPFHLMAPYIKELNNANTTSLRRPEDR
jgi:hypothetical protein